MQVEDSKSENPCGSIMGFFSIGPAWPPSSEQNVYECTSEGTHVLLYAQQQGRIGVRLQKSSTGQQIEMQSPPLTIEGISDLPFTLQWDWSRSKARFKLFNSIWFKPDMSFQTPFPVPPRNSALPPLLIVTDGSSERLARKSLADRIKHRPYFKVAEEELAIEMDQLRDLAFLMREGPNHLRGAIARIRLLIADSPGLLQVVAGKLDAPLRVYANSGLPPPVEFQLGPELISKISMSTPRSFVVAPKWGFRFETDLDTWLADDDNFIQGERVSNKNLIKSIADKIGAHSDLGARTTIEMLLKGSAKGQTDLYNYVHELSISTLELADIVLRHRG